MRRVLNLIVVFCLLALAGCGGGNNGSGGLTGAVSVESEQKATDSSSTVSFTISYTNPYKSTVGGVPVNYTVTLNGQIIDHVATNFGDSGTNTSGFTIGYLIPKTSSPQVVKCVANSANLYSSSIEVIEPLGALNVTPATQEFSATDLVDSSKTYTISGGSGVYTAISSNEALVTVIVSGKTLIATRKSAGAGTVTLTVTDSNTLETVAVQATLVAIPPAP